MQPSFLSDFNDTWILSTDFEKHSNIKFYENRFNGDRVIPFGQMDGPTDGQTDMAKLIVAFTILRTRLRDPSYSLQNEMLESCEG